MISMKINDRIVHAYLNGNSIENYKNEWYFTNSTVASQIGKNIFAAPKDSDEQKANVREVYTRLRQAAQGFEPINAPIWDILFLNWRETLAHVQVDLILGFPEPFDATVEQDNNGLLDKVSGSL